MCGTKAVGSLAQYGQWDGHYTGQGKAAAQFVSNFSNVEKLKAAFDQGLVFDIHEKALQAESRDEESSPNNDRLFNIKADSLSRDTGAKILGLTANTTEQVPVELAVNFIFDRLSCEWAYVADLDENMLEVYAGQGERETSGRFAQVELPRNNIGLLYAGYHTGF